MCRVLQGERLSIQRGSSAGIQYHRPKLMPIENFEHRPGGLDPADVFSAAQTIAAKLVATGQTQTPMKRLSSGWSIWSTTSDSIRWHACGLMRLP